MVPPAAALIEGPGFLRRNAPWLSAGVLLTFLSSFGQTYLISVFAGSLRGEFGLSHGAWGGLYSMGTLVSGALMIWGGSLTDHFRAKHLGFVVLGCLAAACLFMSAITAVWMLPIGIFFLRFFGQGMSSHTAMVFIARWFVATRGKALSIATLGFGVGEAFLPLIFVWLLGFSSWRTLWVGSAVLVLAMIPLLAWLLRSERSPKSIAEESHAFGLDNRHWGRVDVLRHPLFWLLVPAFLGPPVFITAFFFQQVHTAEVKGWALLDLVKLFPLFTLGSIAAMIVSGWFIDKFGASRLLGIALVPLAAGFLLFSGTESLTVAAIAMLLMAFTQGCNRTLGSAVWAELYGTRYLGSVKAMATAFMVFGTAIGPAITGFLIDAGYTFPQQLPAIAVYLLAAALLAGLAVERQRRRLPAAP